MAPFLFWREQEMERMTTASTGVVLPEDLQRRLSVIAASKCVSRSALIRAVCVAFVRAWEAEQGLSVEEEPEISDPGMEAE